MTARPRRRRSSTTVSNPPVAELKLPSVADCATAVLLVIVVAILFGRGLHAPLIYDDHTSIVKNASVRTLWPPIGSAELPGPLNPPRDISTSGRPLANLTLALNYRFGGLQPAGYHAVNIALHALSTLLVWAIARRILRSPNLAGRFDTVTKWLAFLIALVWAVHPLHSETVTYVTQRTELLVGLFYLLTIFASVRYFAAETVGQRRAWLVFASIACLLGACSKEMIVTAPLVVLLIERTFWRGSFRCALASSWPLYLALATSWLVLAALNAAGPRSHSAGFQLDVPVLGYWATQAKVLFLYLKLAIWPWPLTIRYPISATTSLATTWPWLVAAVLLIGGSVVACLRGSIIGALATIAILILSPTLVVPIITEVAAERRMYLPLAPLVSIVVAGGYQFLRRYTEDENSKPRRGARNSSLRWTIRGALVLTFALGLVTMRRLHDYDSPITLWESALALAPEDATIENNLGDALTAAGRANDAIPHYQSAIDFDPQLALAQLNLGIAYVGLGKPAEAIPQFEAAAKLAPEDAQAPYNLGIAQHQTGDLAAAQKSFQAAVDLDPSFAAAHNNLAATLSAAGHTQEAASHYEQALRLDPSYAEARFGLAIVLNQMEHRAAARGAAERARGIALEQNKRELAGQIDAWLLEHR